VQLASSKPQQQETSASDLAVKQCERIIRVVVQKEFSSTGKNRNSIEK
jgi:hypothetical protein